VLTFLFFMVIFFIIVSSIARRGREQAQADPRARRGRRGPIILPMPGSWGRSDSWGDSGGGFSGGGGSFGGGGASGSW
jgi:uncharacterized protein